jgi:hypothetical protein
MDSFDGDDLSTALGTETLAGREMVPEGFDNAPNSRDNMPIELVNGRGFLRRIKGIEDLKVRFRASLAR